MLRVSYRGAKRIVVFALGGLVLVVGLLLLVLPGPGLVVVFFGLTILASEFAWARTCLRRLRVSTKRAGRRARRWYRERSERPTDPPRP
jgi:uncharacterized protein (TIGR02611 family)